MLRDERADLQNSTAGRTRVRTPGRRQERQPHDLVADLTGDDGVQVERASTDVTGPVPLEPESGPVGTRDSVPVLAPARADSDPGAVDARLDRPPPPGLRPIHPIDELTPPAIDVDELQDKR